MKRPVVAVRFFFVPAEEPQELEDLRAVLKLPSGRRVFRRLLDAGNVFGASMAAEGRSTEYNEGLRAVGLWLANRIEIALPGEIARLLAESARDRLA